MKVRNYKDEKTGKVGIELIPEFCAEEEQLIQDLAHKKTQLIVTKNPFARSIALVREEDAFSVFSAVEDVKGGRWHLNPFRKQEA